MFFFITFANVKINQQTLSMEAPIPEKTRPEWAKIITGEIEHKYDNYVFQTKIHQLRKGVKAEKVTISDAINDLYELCVKYAASIRTDLSQIFENQNK